MHSVTRSLFRSFSELLFLDGMAMGAGLFALSLCHPQVGLAGVIAVLAAYWFARLIHLEETFLDKGLYTYNSLLVGMGIGFVFQINGLTIFLIVAASLLTLLLSVSLSHLFKVWFNLPVLSLPFALGMTIIYLATLPYSNLLVAAPRMTWLATWDQYFPVWLGNFFASFGSLLFSPHAISGMIIATMILLRSRILILLAVVGYYTGTLTRWAMFGSAHQAFNDPYNLNFILIAMAVGGVFLVPSLRSYLLAMVAVVISTIVLDAIETTGATLNIPAYILPFNLVSLGMLYALGVSSDPSLAKVLGRTPEETLEHDLATRSRFPHHARILHLPFYGSWSVWQGQEGAWTHKGAWSYAIDFVITDDANQTYANEGTELQDYLCYRKPVLSPVRGRVVKVVNDLPDNEIGQVELKDNWGNLVIIEDLRGFCVELSHFATESIRVQQGEWVEPGTMLGLCGNSGYSPQPHLHIQVQATDRIGAATLPFCFAGYLLGGEHRSYEVPELHDKIEPPKYSRALDQLTTFLFGDQLHFELHNGGNRQQHCVIKTDMAPDGTFYFDCEGTKLYFGKQDGCFWFYRLEGNHPALQLLYRAIPRIPLVESDQLSWRDGLPVGVANSGLKRILSRFLASFLPHFGRVEAELIFRTPFQIQSVIKSGVLCPALETVVNIDPQAGLISVQSEHQELIRVSDPQEKEKQDTTVPNPSPPNSSPVVTS